MATRVEILSEPAPPPRASGAPRYELGAHIRYILNGKCIGTAKTPAFRQNERRTRESRKY